MSIEELMEKTTIAFPKSLSLKETERLLGYVAQQLPGNINYQVEYYMSIIYKPDHVKKEEGTVRISGTITSLNRPLAFDVFQTEHSKDDTSKIRIIRFSLAPDWELEDYRPEVQRLWDDVREIIVKYFEQKKVF